MFHMSNKTNKSLVVHNVIHVIRDVIEKQTIAVVLHAIQLQTTSDWPYNDLKDLSKQRPLANKHWKRMRVQDCRIWSADGRVHKTVELDMWYSNHHFRSREMWTSRNREMLTIMQVKETIHTDMIVWVFHTPTRKQTEKRTKEERLKNLAENCQIYMNHWNSEVWSRDENIHKSTKISRSLAIL